LNGVITPVVVGNVSDTMRAEVPQDVAALLEQFDRRIEESQALRVELQEKTAERHAADVKTSWTPPSNMKAGIATGEEHK
jgi:hypothetical protein